MADVVRQGLGAATGKTTCLGAGKGEWINLLSPSMRCSSWFRKSLETNLWPLATNIEVSSLLIFPQNQLITKSGQC